MNICAEQESPEHTIHSPVRVHVRSRQQLGRVTASLQYNPCIYKDMWEDWKCILTFHINLIRSAETWINHFNEFTCVGFLQGKNEPASWLRHPHLTSVGLKSSVVEVHVKLVCLLSYFRCLSGLLWCCPFTIKNINMWLEWRCPAKAFSRALSFWPCSTTRSAAHTICTSIKSCHAIREGMKSERLLANFFFFQTASQRRARTMEALGCCRTQIETYCRNAQHY